MTLDLVPSLKESSDALSIVETPEAPTADRDWLRSLTYEDAAAALQPPGAAGPAPAPSPERQRHAERMAQWDKKAPKHNYKRVRFRAVSVSKRTRTLLRRAEKIMQDRFDQPDFQFVLTQGSYNTGVSASAGTHDGGGAVDIRTRGYPKHVVDKMVRALRMAGFAAWSRGRGADTMTPHIHAIAVGDREVTPIARAQVADFAQGRNGLRGHAADPDRHLKATPPSWAGKKLARM